MVGDVPFRRKFFFARLAVLKLQSFELNYAVIYIETRSMLHAATCGVRTRSSIMHDLHRVQFSTAVQIIAP